jgi:disulfide oxidoreductase YuzD
VKHARIKWLDRPQKHDYPAAESYLRLTLDPRTARNVVEKLRRAKTTNFAAKDVFRASGLSLLGVSNSHVQEKRTQIIEDEALSPILLYRDRRSRRLIVADGYHRLCAVYTFEEDAMIPCRIV